VIEFKYISKKFEQQWEELVKNSGSSGFMQSCFWCDFKRKTGWETFKIGLFEDGKLIGGTVAMKFHYSKTKNFLYLPEGPILPYGSPNADKYFDELIGEIDAVADLKGDELTTHLRIEPRLSEVPIFFRKFDKAPYNMEPRHTLMLDLSQSEKEILAQMKQKGRYNIKIADKNNVEVIEDPSEAGIKKFIKLYKETTDRKKFEGKSDKYFYALVDALQKNKTGTLYIAQSKNIPLAAAIVIFYGDRSTYFFGATSNKDREKMAPYKLHFEIAKASKAKNFKWYDFWGIAPADADQSHDWYGFTQFKKKFGGKSFRFIGAYDFVYNKKLYLEFLKESGEI